MPGFIFPATFTISGLKCSSYLGSLSPAADREPYSSLFVRVPIPISHSVLRRTHRKETGKDAHAMWHKNPPQILTQYLSFLFPREYSLLKNPNLPVTQNRSICDFQVKMNKRGRQLRRTLSLTIFPSSYCLPCLLS